MVEISTETGSGALWLPDDEKAVKLLRAWAADYVHDPGSNCAPFMICVQVCYVDHQGFEIPRPSHVPGLLGASTQIMTGCPHHAYDAVRVMSS